MKKNESGRSMVEMLGVLAIIGVLSVGGIAGYTLAMNKYRQAEVSNAIALTYVEAVAQGKQVAYADVANGVTVPAGLSGYITNIQVDEAGGVTITGKEASFKCEDVDWCKDGVTAAVNAIVS